MKKFLLSLAAVVLVGASALAKEYTITMSKVTTFNADKTKTSFTAEGFTFLAAKNTGSTAPTYNAKGGDYRIYAKGSLTITAPAGVNMTNVSVTISEAGKKRQTNITASDGAVTEAAGSFAWAGSVNELKLTVGDKCTLGTDGEKKAGQFCFTDITITTDEGAGPEKTDAGLVFASETVNASLGEAVPANTLTKATDAAAVYTSSNVEVATVDAATGEVTLVAAGTTTIKAATEATEKYKAGEASYTLVVVDPNAKKPANLAFANATVTVDLSEAVPANALTKDTDAAVVYTSSNVEVATVDAATGEVTLVAAGTTTIKAATEATETYEAGEATYTLTVMDKAEIVYENDGKTDASGFTFEVGEGENPWKFSNYGMNGSAFKIAGKTADAYAVSPVFDLTNRIKPISITQTFAYNYITVAQVPEYFTIAVREEGATEWTVLTAAPAPEAMNDKKWTYVDDYAIDLGAYEGKKIQIGYHYVADGTVCGGWQIKNILVKGKKSSAVSDITVEDSDAPVVYYNMQGVRVANPANGLYIRVQGKKATKVLVR